MKLIEKHKCFNGDQEVYSHNSSSNKCLMQFAVYSPEKKIDAPVLYFLSGITCNEQNFIQKSGYQKFASENQIAIVVPDTSPRGEEVPDDEDYKLGKGAGFYLNATSEKWSQNYNMYDYICLELPKLIKLTSFSSSFFLYSLNSPNTFIMLTLYIFLLYFFKEIAELMTASTVATFDINGLQ